MSASLDNRSSLRKLEFPNCTIEALKRLHAMLSSVSHKVQTKSPHGVLVLSPKETESVLDVIDEFVFFVAKPAKSSKSAKKSSFSHSQDLQRLQILVDFYQTQPGDEENDVTMLLLTNYLFMDSPKDEKKVGERALILAKLTCLSLGLRSKAVLHSVGLWMQAQGPAGQKSVQLVRNIDKNYLDLVPDLTHGLDNMPDIAPVFAVNFITAVTEYLCSEGKHLSLQLAQVFTRWMRSRSSLLPLNGLPMLASLTKWTVLHPLGGRKFDDKEAAVYSQLHLLLLESLADLKGDTCVKSTLTSKQVVGIVQCVDEKLSADKSVSALSTMSIDLSLDRLGQFLNCAMASGRLAGKTAEVCSPLRHLPQNRIVEMFIHQYGQK